MRLSNDLWTTGFGPCLDCLLEKIRGTGGMRFEMSLFSTRFMGVTSTTGGGIGGIANLRSILSNDTWWSEAFGSGADLLVEKAGILFVLALEFLRASFAFCRLLIADR